MTISKISLKLFFSFFLIMALTFLSFFLIMRSFRIQEFEKMHAYYRDISVLAFTEVFSSGFKPYSAEEIRNNHHYLELLNRFAEKYQLKIVITDQLNQVLLHTYPAQLPANFTAQIGVYRDNTDKFKNPFPIVIERKTENHDQIKIFLLNGLSVDDNVFLMHLLLIMLFAINIIMLFLVSRWITRPVGKFREAIKSISDGDFSTEIKINSHDEFDDLANTINSMAFRIKQTMAEQKETSANISHELRSPLTRIKVALQILHDLTGESREQDLGHYFDAMDRDIDGMDNLINGILKLYRIDSDCAQMKYNMDVIEILKEELELQKNYFEHLKIKVETDFQIDSYKIRLSPTIKTAFSNIISNGAKYSVESLFKVTAFEENRKVVVVFENRVNPDHGIENDKLVIPFYRGKNAKNIQGSGMGLPITRRILEMSNASFDCRIEDNIFRVTIRI